MLRLKSIDDVVETLMMLFNDYITLFHNNGISSNNIVECMAKINDALYNFMRSIQ